MRAHDYQEAPRDYDPKNRSIGFSFTCYCLRSFFNGWTADQAWQEMKDYDFENGWLGGPGAQKKFVFAFYDQHRSALGQK